MQKPFVVWSGQFSVGVKTADELHRGLFDLANGLHAAGASIATHFGTDTKTGRHMAEQKTKGNLTGTAY